MKTQTDITEERVVHNGFETFLRRSGSPTLPAMLLIHGSGPGATGWSNWQYLMPELGGQFHCLALDLCGYGGSPAPDAMPKNTADRLRSGLPKSSRWCGSWVLTGCISSATRWGVRLRSMSRCARRICSTASR
ncbi:hypothetical protein ATER59S_01068 [Aquamicrobium terrae]